jgi:hypothetical protein
MPSQLQTELKLMSNELTMWRKILNKSQNPRNKKMATSRTNNIKVKLDEARNTMQLMYFTIYDIERILSGTETEMWK